MEEYQINAILLALLAVSEVMGLQTKFGPGSIVGVILGVIRALSGKK